MNTDVHAKLADSDCATGCKPTTGSTNDVSKANLQRDTRTALADNRNPSSNQWLGEWYVLDMFSSINSHNVL